MTWTPRVRPASSISTPEPTGPTITGTSSCPASQRDSFMHTGGSQSGSCTPPRRQCRHGSQKRDRRPGHIRLGGRYASRSGFRQDDHLRDVCRWVHPESELGRRGRANRGSCRSTRRASSWDSKRCSMTTSGEFVRSFSMSIYRVVTVNPRLGSRHIQLFRRAERRWSNHKAPSKRRGSRWNNRAVRGWRLYASRACNYRPSWRAGFNFVELWRAPVCCRLDMFRGRCLGLISNFFYCPPRVDSSIA